MIGAARHQLIVSARTSTHEGGSTLVMKHFVSKAQTFDQTRPQREIPHYCTQYSQGNIEGLRCEGDGSRYESHVRAHEPLLVFERKRDNVVVRDPYLPRGLVKLLPRDAPFVDQYPRTVRILQLVLERALG